MELPGTVALVTGSAGTIGTEIAIALARARATVVCTDLDAQRLERTLEAVRSHAHDSIALTADVTDRAQVDRLVAETVERFGRIDVLVNNAGLFRALGAVHEVDPDAWWRDVTVNLLGPFLFARAVLPHMLERDHGVIVNISGAGFGSAIAGGSAYCCSKTAVIRLTETMAVELGPGRPEHGVEGLGSNVFVVTVEPPFVDSGMTRGMVETPAGRRWLPFLLDAFDAGGGEPAADVAAAVCRAIGSAEQLSGLVWSYSDDVGAVAANAGTGSMTDETAAFRLRVRRPGVG